MWDQALPRWREWLQATNHSRQTVRLRTHQLRRFSDAHRRGYLVGAEDVARYLARPDWSTETKRSTLAALRSFYGWAQASGLVDVDPSRLIGAIRPSTHPPRPAPETVVREALAIPDGRVRLMLLLAARQGLRRGEISRVHSRDLVPDLLGWSLVVHGKGGKDRVVPLADDVARELQLRPGGWAFPGRIDGHLSADYVGKLMAAHLRSEWTAHTLRHRFATVAYAGTRDLLAVQELMGHARPETTRAYIRLPQDSLRAAVDAAA